MISGIITATLLLAFVGIAVWAWSASNRERFAEAASLPFGDDSTPQADVRRDPRKPHEGDES